MRACVLRSCIAPLVALSLLSTVALAAESVPGNPPPVAPGPSAPAPGGTVTAPAPPGSGALDSPPPSPTPNASPSLMEGAVLPEAALKSLNAVRLSAAPKMDGDVSDAVWREASVTGPFTHQSGPPAFQTVARFGYTQDTLYIAWQCADPNPSLILAQQTKRDGDLSKDDHVSLGVDALNDRRSYYWFQVNPIGTTNVEIPGGSSAKVGWRGDWRASARRTDKGWEAEMAIPFVLLRYPSGQNTFTLIFRRHIARVDEESSWPQQTSYYDHAMALAWQGVVTPKIVRKPIYLPYVIAGAGDNIHNDAGLDIKYTTENNITNLFTVRPDFQTVEDAVQTIDFTYNPRFIPDRRPFFTEGGDYFGDSRLFYSRTIDKVDLGAKSFGKIGPISFGGLDTYHFGGDNNFVGRFGYDLGPLSNVSMALANHWGEDGLRNTVIRVGGEQSQQKKVGSLWMGASAYQSFTSGMAGGDGQMYNAYVDRYSGWGMPGWHFNYRRVPKDFFPALGFLSESNYRGMSTFEEYGREYHKGPLQHWNLQLDANYYDFDDTGKTYRKALAPSIDLLFRNKLSLLYANETSYRAPHRDHLNHYQFGWFSDNIYKNGSFTWRMGRVNGGDYHFYSFRQGWRFANRWSVNFSREKFVIDYGGTQKNDEAFQTIYGLVYDITPERSLAARVLQQTGGTSSFVAYRQELRNGVDAFLILGDPNALSSNPLKRIGLKLVNAY